jgi:cytochrome c peroxidase
VPQIFHLAYDITANPPTEKDLNWVKTILWWSASDGLVSCGFCHQENAFTHHGHTVSHGVTMPWEQEMHLLFRTWLFNVFLCMMEPVSFRSATHHSFDKWNRNEWRFKCHSAWWKGKLIVNCLKFFTDGTVSVENMLKALSQFMVMLTSSNSKSIIIDVMKEVPLSDETAGYAVLNQMCFLSCYWFNDWWCFRNNGLAINPLMMDVTALLSKYKIITNSKCLVCVMWGICSIYARWSFWDIEAVLNHYSSELLIRQH